MAAPGRSALGLESIPCCLVDEMFDRSYECLAGVHLSPLAVASAELPALKISGTMSCAICRLEKGADYGILSTCSLTRGPHG